MPILNKPDMNYGVWAEGGNIEIPSSEKVYEGWVVEKPLNETMNWLQNRQDRMLQYINERGIPEWDSRTEYPLESYVARSGVIYKALSPSTDKDPTLHTDIWHIAFVSQADFDNYSETVDSITTEDGYLRHYVKKSNPEMDAPCRGIEYNNISNSSGLRFSENTPEISASGVTIATFSGGTNPKDVVTHEQLALAIQNYKVGDIYITTANGDPSERLGYGTWQRFGKGRTLVGFSDEVSNTIPEWVKVSNREFGEYEHKLSEEEIPAHKHRSYISWGGSGTPDVEGFQRVSSWDGHANDNVSDSFGYQETTFTGGDQPHNNVQPSIVVYFWKRTA